MKFREMQALDDTKLNDLYEDLKEQLYRLRLNQASGELVDTSQFRKVRRDVARIMTLLGERQAGTKGK